jgi:hypothetical protein
MRYRNVLAVVSAFAILFGAAQAMAVPATATVGGTTYTMQGLVGVGRLPANTRDKFGETFGSISGLWANAAAWQRTATGYSGQFISLPDRGYNVAGTIDYTPRFNIIDFSFAPVSTTSAGNPQSQLALTLRDTVLLREANGTLMTGLDPRPGGVATGGARAATATLPELPQAFNGKLALDAEGIVRLPFNGGWLISDEYGPSIYRFDNAGVFQGALPVPQHLRPVRNAVTDYSSNNAATGQPAPSPANPVSGRQNNQGFEGMSLAPDGKTLIVVLQSAARQDLNSANAPGTRGNTRVLTYDISNPAAPALTGEFALALPSFLEGSNTRFAAQSEIYALSATRFLILPRDGNGFGTAIATSLYRDVDIVDLTGATNLLGSPLAAQIAPNGTLNSAITPAALTRWLNINDNSELSRFGLRNGGAQDGNNLSDKWEGLALLPTLEVGLPDDYFLFVANDNDFRTTDGFQVGGAYNDGTNIDTMFLVYRVTMPGFRLVSEPAALGLFGLGFAGLIALKRRRA